MTTRDDAVYIVSYSTGEYSDRFDWPAAWYPTRAEADAHVAEWHRLYAAAQASPGFGPAGREWTEAFYCPIPPTPEVEAFAAFADWGLPECGVSRSALHDFGLPTVTEVPRGTLALHGFGEETQA